MREALPDVAMYYQYGLTEAGPSVTRLRPEDMFDPELDGSIGREFWLTEVSIRDASGDDVAEAAAIGYQSAAWDEEVRAIVALRPGSPDVEPAALADLCRTHLAGYKVPKRIAVVPLGDIPVSPSGKILKRVLRDTFAWDRSD